MSETLLLVFVLIGLQSIVLSQTILGSCDYHRFKANGCEDELGADCEPTTNQCRCKSGNWVVVDKRFCFPTTCPEDQYYDHNFGQCKPKITANYHNQDNYCKHDFQCKGLSYFYLFMFFTESCIKLFKSKLI